MHVTSSLNHSFAAVGVVGVLLLVACSSPAPTAPAPSTIVGQAGGGLIPKATAVDLGRVPFDVQVDGRFELVNTSPRMLKLTAAPQVKMLEGC
jgi:hypothetical protein